MRIIRRTWSRASAAQSKTITVQEGDNPKSCVCTILQCLCVCIGWFSPCNIQNVTSFQKCSKTSLHGTMWKSINVKVPISLCPLPITQRRHDGIFSPWQYFIFTEYISKWAWLFLFCSDTLFFFLVITSCFLPDDKDVYVCFDQGGTAATLRTVLCQLSPRSPAVFTSSIQRTPTLHLR